MTEVCLCVWVKEWIRRCVCGLAAWLPIQGKALGTLAKTESIQHWRDALIDHLPCSIIGCYIRECLANELDIFVWIHCVRPVPNFCYWRLLAWNPGSWNHPGSWGHEIQGQEKSIGRPYREFFYCYFSFRIIGILHYVWGHNYNPACS